MHYFLLGLVLIILTLCSSVRSDPRPTGGANCTIDEQCGGVGAGGKCVDDVCYCPIHMANPDCSYHRKNAQYGWLNFLCVLSLPGLGDIYIGRDGHAGGQAIFMWVGLIGLLPALISWIAFQKDIKSCICIERKPAGITLAVIFGTLWFIGFLWSIYNGLKIAGMEGIVDGAEYELYIPM
jgi:hypothetical protein